MRVTTAMSTDHRQAARERLSALVAVFRGRPDADNWSRLVEEADSLDRAIAAFHLEGIRFRMYNVDRLLTHGSIAPPSEAVAAFSDVRRHLEAAGFHTRSHQAPG